MNRSTSGILGLIERVGNALPAPATLFVIGCAAVMLLSHIGTAAGWEVDPVAPVRVDGPDGRPTIQLELSGDPIRPQSLLTADGLYWALSTMVQNFVDFPPLGIVLVGMLGVGVAERVGLFNAVLKALMLITPRRLLTPMVVFLGINSNILSDAGYVVLPPLAAGLYIAAGRSPIAGIAAAFAGVSAGFSAGLFVSAGDALICAFTEGAAHLVDESYTIDATSNWFFLAASAFVLTFVGWGVSSTLVEPRLATRPFEDGGPPPAGTRGELGEPLSATEKQGLAWAGLVHALVLGLVIAAVLIEGGPLNGDVETRPGVSAPKWTRVIVPVILLAFLLPGVVYGAVTGSARGEKAVAKLMVDSMAAMGPIITLAFFAAQFLKYFEYSNLGRMVAMAGGKALAAAELPMALLLVLLVVLTMLINLIMSSMSAKYALMAPVFVPMFMMVGVSPALTQVAYRVGDSVTNILTPLNAYLVIILAFMQRYTPRAGMGTLLAMMAPYSVVFAIVWILFLVAWIQLGLPLGPRAGLTYLPQ